MLRFRKTKKAMSVISVFIILVLNLNVASATWGWTAPIHNPVTVLYEGTENYCNVTIYNGIRTDMKYAEAATTLSTNNTTITHSGSVSATFYVLNTKTNATRSFGYGNGGTNGGGVSGTCNENEIIYKIVSDHTATYGSSFYSYDDLTCIAP